jgi:hypothetical protein
MDCVNLMPDEFSKTLIGNHITEVFFIREMGYISILELDLVLLLTIERAGKYYITKTKKLLPKKYNIV